MLLSDMECYHNVRMLSNTKKKQSNYYCKNKQ